MWQIKIKAKKTAYFFLLTILLLTLLHCVALFLFFHSDNPRVLDFTLWFDLDTVFCGGYFILFSDFFFPFFLRKSNR